MGRFPCYAVASSMDKQQQQSALTMLNMFNMAQLFSNMQQQQQQQQQQQSAAQLNAFGQLCNGASPFDFSSLLGGSGSQEGQASFNGTSSGDEELQTPKTGTALRRMLEKFGLDLSVPAGTDSDRRKRKFERLHEDTVPEVSQVECRQCQTSFGSLLALKTHCEESHQGGVPSEVVEEFSERLRRALDDVEDRESVQDQDDSCEPPEPKRMREVKSEDQDDSPKALRPALRPRLLLDQRMEPSRT
uniref:C2H2-type domain-containing protein n=1 Tax=Steinernema glaseri TaxID=37863 RepID=A0A1I7YPJ9_9BILA